MKTKTWFKTWTTPFVDLEMTLLLFATFIFHHYYFGDAQTNIHDFFAVARGYALVLPIYGGLILLFSLFKLSDEWRPFATLMTFLGSGLITLTYTAMDWLALFTPNWMELLLQWYYLLQAVKSGLQVILFLIQKPDAPQRITPQLTAIPTFFKSLLILAYVMGFTLLLDHQWHVAPELVTSRINFFGLLLLQIEHYIRQFRHQASN